MKEMAERLETIEADIGLVEEDIRSLEATYAESSESED